MVETLLQVDASYGSSEKIILRDVQDTVRLALADGEGDDGREEEHSAGSVNRPEEPAEEEAWYFDDLQDADYWTSWHCKLCVICARNIVRMSCKV